MQAGRLTLELFRMLLEAPVKYRHLEAVLMPVLPRLMERLRSECSKAQVILTSYSVLSIQDEYPIVADVS